MSGTSLLQKHYEILLYSIAPEFNPDWQFIIFQTGLHLDDPMMYSLNLIAMSYHAMPSSLDEAKKLLDKANKGTRPLRILAAEDEMRGDSQLRTGVYMSGHEDSSTESTKQFSSAVEFSKRSTLLNAEIELAYAWICIKQNNMRVASLHLDNVKKIDKDNFLLDLLFGIRYDNSNDTRELSFKHLLNAVQKFPNSFRACYHYSLVLKDLGQLSLAVNWMKVAISINPTYQLCYFHLSNMFFDDHKFEERNFALKISSFLQENKSATPETISQLIQQLASPQSRWCGIRSSRPSLNIRHLADDLLLRKPVSSPPPLVSQSIHFQQAFLTTSVQK